MTRSYAVARCYETGVPEAPGKGASEAGGDPQKTRAGVRLIVLLPGEDDAGSLWAHGIVEEWSAELQLEGREKVRMA